MMLFDKWSSEEVKVSDLGLKDYINLKPVLLPKSHGRPQKYRFWKSKQHIIERLMNKIPVSGHKGKKHWKSSGEQIGSGYTLIKIIIKTLEVIEKKTKSNPIQVIVKAIENSAPREETITIQYGGTRHPRAVDTSPQRRIDLSLRWITQGAKAKTHHKKTKVWQSLANEIIDASNNDPKSNAVSKCNEVERQAQASR